MGDEGIGFGVEMMVYELEAWEMRISALDVEFMRDER
jgi:hypothetical protein